jgi:hypothetical protein
MSVDRKAAVTGWKERKTAPGSYAIRLVPSGERWLGQAADLAKVQKSPLVCVATGSQTNRALEAALTQHSADALVFEVIERLVDEENAAAKASRLRNAPRRWRDEAGAAAV